MSDMDKWLCSECEAILFNEEIDIVNDPKSGAPWHVCPHCRTPENMVKACDAKGCKFESTAGLRNEIYRYINVCSKHWPERNEGKFTPDKHLSPHKAGGDR